MTGTRQRRLDAIEAGHTGDADVAIALLSDDEPVVRAAALAALDRLGRATSEQVGRALADPVGTVRARACQIAIDLADLDLTPLLGDPDETVAEAAAFALGEREDPAAVEPLAGMAREHPDELCREAAVAALGAVAQHASDDTPIIDCLLDAMTEKATIRRRVVIALHQFDDERATAAVEAALEDQDRQVRGLAGELLGVAVD